MLIKKIIRSYSRSVNTVSLMIPDPTKSKPEDSWVKFEATYEAELESMDDPALVSNELIKKAKKDVADNILELQNLIRGVAPSQ